MYVSLRMVRGDDRTFTLDLVEGGAAMDLTGADVRFVAKRAIGDEDDDAFLVKTVGDGIEIDDDPTSGRAVLTIDAADTSDLTGLERFSFGVRVTRGGSTRTPISGRLEVSPDVARTTP